MNGNAMNIFLPWMVNLDGTDAEIVNHVGRHEIAVGFSEEFHQGLEHRRFEPERERGLRQPVGS